MSENIDLTKILKDCPIGTKLYSTLCGEVKLKKVENDKYPIGIENNDGDRFWLTKMENTYLVLMENVFYFLLKNKEIGVNSLLLGTRKKNLTLIH